jgi:hypothetical protein
MNTMATTSEIYRIVKEIKNDLKELDDKTDIIKEQTIRTNGSVSDLKEFKLKAEKDIKSLRKRENIITGGLILLGFLFVIILTTASSYINLYIKNAIAEYERTGINY